MKKSFLVLVSIGFLSTLFASNTFECSRYVNGKWKGYVNVKADSKVEAEYKAKLKYEKMGTRYDYIKCKW